MYYLADGRINTYTQTISQDLSDNTTTQCKTVHLKDNTPEQSFI